MTLYPPPAEVPTEVFAPLPDPGTCAILAACLPAGRGPGDVFG